MSGTCAVCGHIAHDGRCDADLDQERRCRCGSDVCFNCLEPHPDVPGHDDRTCPHCERLCRPLAEDSPEPVTRDDSALVDALISSYSILSLLHHRGLVNSQFNRDDVAAALRKLEPFALAAERITRGQRNR